MNVIVYEGDGGVLAIVCPAPEFVRSYGFDAVAGKDVPAGKSYKIVDSSKLPQDPSQRLTWSMADIPGQTFTKP